jgi:hypothetical protein
MTSPPPAASSVPTRTRTTGADRVRDAIALTLVVAGVVLVVMAYNGNSHLASQPIVVAKGQSAFSLWMRNYYMEFAGYGAIAAGILVGLGSYIVHARRARRDQDARRSGAT